MLDFAKRAGSRACEIARCADSPAGLRLERHSVDHALLLPSTADFLTSSAGTAVSPSNPDGFNDGTAATSFSILAGFGLKGPLIHYNRINAFTGCFQDDIKVNRKLTVKAGVRWEYDGFPSDKIGQFTNVWNTQLARFNTGSAFPANPIGTLIGFVVPSNYDTTAGFTAPNGATEY